MIMEITNPQTIALVADAALSAREDERKLSVRLETDLGVSHVSVKVGEGMWSAPYPAIGGA